LIYWDGLGLGAQHTGIAQYARQLLDALDVLGQQVSLVADPATLKHYPKARHLPVKLSGLNAALAKTKVFWPRYCWNKIRHDPLFKRGHSIVHGLSNINIPLIPPRGVCHRVITVHDIIPLLAPDSVSQSYFWQYRMLMPLVLARADVVVCVSQWTKNTLEQQYPQYADKMVVIANGVPLFQPRLIDKKQAKVCRLLTVSRFEKYKNFSLLMNILRAAGKDCQLDLVTDEVGMRWAKARAPDLIGYGLLRVWQHLSQKELQSRYHEADVYIHPSYYEGFCLPLVEALASGVPALYMSGTGPDDYADQRFCRGISVEAGARDWLSSIWQLQELSKQDNYLSEIKRYYDTLPTWNQAAELLITRYTNLNIT